MAYAVKYLFKFQSSNGIVREIRVLQDGYSGDVIQRPLGRAPVIKKEQNGGVHGTSLTFYAECHVDQEYIEFYTSDPKEYRVDVYAGSTLLWQGYITPELYSEPDIAPPYDVQVVATDGVGELKLYDFTPQGTVTLRSLLAYLLGYTGLSTDVNLISSLKPGSRGAGALLDMQICIDYFAGKDCYEALTYILDTLHATITRWGGAWLLVRETNVTFTGDKVRYFNTSGNSALLAGSVQTLGAMRSAPAWPVGQLSTVIDPAKNKVVVQAPWHPVSGLVNSAMTSDTGWTKAGGAVYDATNVGYHFPAASLSALPRISQEIVMSGLRMPFRMSGRFTGVSADLSLGTLFTAGIGFYVTYTTNSATYHLERSDDGIVWKQGAMPGLLGFDDTLSTFLQNFDEDRTAGREIGFTVPPFVQGSAFPAGTLKIYIIGNCARIYTASLDVEVSKGYQDILRIDNGARGEGDEVEIAIGRQTVDVAYYQSFLQGLLFDSGSLITGFTDANFTTAMDYLALISRDYALSAALPRALAKGTVYLESSIGMPPLVFAKGGLNYWLETWSWNLYEDELEIDARTLPSASLTVQSETILESNGSMVSSGASGGSSGGSIDGGAGVNYFQINSDRAELVELKSQFQYLGPKKGLIFDANSSEDAVADLEVVTKTIGGQTMRVLHSRLPFYTDGFLSGGGLSTTGGGGGGGGLDPATMWSLLAAPTSEPINPSHITFPVTSVVGQTGNITASQIATALGLGDLAYKDSLVASDIPDLSATYQPKDADLTAIAGLTGTSGLLKKTAANTWTLDTSAYITGINSTMVTTALGYTPADSTALADYVTLATAQTITARKTFTAQSSAVFQLASNLQNNYTEGARFNIGGANSWGGFTIGGTAVNGTGVGIWAFLVHDKALYIGHNGSSSATYGLSWTSDGALNFKTSALTNNGNTIYHSGNFIAGTDYFPMTGGYIRSGTDYARLRLITDATNTYIQALTSSGNAGNLFLSGGGATNGSKLWLGFNYVGVGISDPTYRFQVHGASAVNVGDFIHIENTADFNWTNTLTGYAPNLTTGHNMSISLGKAASTKNLGALQFYFAGDGSNANAVGLGLYGVDYILSCFGNGNVSVGNGTTDAGYKLYVNGSVGSAGRATVGSLKLSDGAPTLTWDATNSAWHLSGSLYVDGFLSGGGLSTTGGGGGIDPTAMWNLLAAPTTEQINSSHITFPVTSVVNQTGNVTATQIANAIGLDDKVAKAGDTMTGPLVINSSVSGNYNEGVRITRAANDWAGITFGSTGASGAPTDGWFAATNPDGQFIISPGSSSNTSGLTLNKAGDLKWRNNVVYHAGNFAAGVNYVAPAALSNYLPLTAGLNTPLTGALQIDATAVFGLYVNNTTSGGTDAGIRFQVGGTTQGGLYVNTSHDLLFYDLTAPRTVYHSGNLTKSVVTGLIGSSTYAPYNAYGYLPLNGGHLTGQLYFDNAYIVFKAGDPIANVGYINVTASNGLRFYDMTAWRDVYHSGNSNKADVAWQASTLTAGNILAYDTTSPYLRFQSDSYTITMGVDANRGYLYNNTASAYLIGIDVANNRFGVGTTSPGYKFHVYGTSGATVTPMSVFEHTGDYQWSCPAAFFAPNLTAGHNASLGIGKAASSKNDGALEFYYAGNSSDSNLFGLGLYGVDYVLTVSGGANVGIGLGTTPASYKLDVNGTVGISTSVWNLINLTRTDVGSGAIGINGNGLNFFNSNTGTNTYLNIKEGYGVGINKAATCALDVNGLIAVTPSTGAALTSTTATGVWNYIRLVSVNTSTSFWDIATINTTGTFIGQANAFEIRDGRDSYTGISIRHATSAYGKLVVSVPSGQCSIGYWSTSLNPTSGYPVWTAGLDGTSAKNFGWYYGYDGGWVMRLSPAGVLWAKTGIYSDGYVSGGGLSTSSDQRLKANIKDFGYSKDLLMSVRPREWDWNELTPMKGHAAGFVAQEIEPILPYAVTDRTYKQLYYDMFHALEISGLQDHERRIAALENENRMLKEEIKRLRS